MESMKDDDPNKDFILSSKNLNDILNEAWDDKFYETSFTKNNIPFSNDNNNVYEKNDPSLGMAPKDDYMCFYENRNNDTRNDSPGKEINYMDFLSGIHIQNDILNKPETNFSDKMNEKKNNNVEVKRGLEPSNTIFESEQDLSLSAHTFNDLNNYSVSEEQKTWPSVPTTNKLSTPISKNNNVQSVPNVHSNGDQPLTYSFKIVNTSNGINIFSKDGSTTKPDPFVFVTGPSTNSKMTTTSSTNTNNSGADTSESNVKELELAQFSTLTSQIFHAFICSLNSRQCLFPNCEKMKQFVQHVRTCTSPLCEIENCSKIRSYIFHFIICPKTQCRSCSTVTQNLKITLEQTEKAHHGVMFNFIYYTKDKSPLGDLCQSLYKHLHSNQPQNNVFNKNVAQINSKSLTQKIPTTQPGITYDPQTKKNVNAIIPINQQHAPKNNGGISIKSSSTMDLELIPVSKNSLTKVAEKVSLKDMECNIENLVEKPLDAKTLSNMFISLVTKMMRMSESHYFKEPVDPQKLGIPDYPEIIREPMDLGTIMNRLKAYKYTSLWSVLYDINLVFDNAFLYNKRNTKVHKGAVKLSNFFNNYTEYLMKSYNYCCNKRYVFSPQVLYCNSNNFCVIPYNAFYYRYDDKSYFCTNCFSATKEETMSCYRENSTIPTLLPKSNFVCTRNNITIYEPFVVCCICRKKFHKVCVMHVDTIDGIYYFCTPCTTSLNINKEPNRFTSRNLPRTKLSDHIEERVNNFLLSEIKDCKYVNIRVICNVHKTLETKKGLIARYGSAISSTFPYRSKAIFAFQEHENNIELCFFSLHVQEYGEDCPEPNRRRVYISYLDSVHYFQPKHLKTLLYHEIILSYLSYCKSIGYFYCHIWSCPPCEGDDYVFHCHSFEQKLPKPRRLLEWYNKMIEVGLRKGIIMEYKDICRYFEGCSDELATKIPYFDGDYWSNSLEDIVNEHEKDTQVNSDSHNKSKNDSFHKKNKHKVSKTKVTPKKIMSEKITLNQKIFSLMEKYREVFFVLKLNNDNVGFSKEVDPIFTSDLMDGRSGFLTMSRDNHWEFSSLRHALYSTKAMMFVVHQQMYNFVEFTCDKCRKVLVEGFHCDICQSDYDLCDNCCKISSHAHNMAPKVYINFKWSGIDNMINSQGSNVSQGASSQSDSKISPVFNDQTASILSMIEHCSKCTVIACTMPQCNIIKKIMYHFEHCKASNRNTCNTCKQILYIYNTHAASCTKKACVVPFCNRIREISNKRIAATEMRTRRRIANMNTEFLKSNSVSESESTGKKSNNTPASNVGSGISSKQFSNSNSPSNPNDNANKNNRNSSQASYPINDPIFGCLTPPTSNDQSVAITKNKPNNYQNTGSSPMSDRSSSTKQGKKMPTYSSVDVKRIQNEIYETISRNNQRSRQSNDSGSIGARNGGTKKIEAPMDSDAGFRMINEPQISGIPVAINQPTNIMKQMSNQKDMFTTQQPPQILSSQMDNISFSNVQASGPMQIRAQHNPGFPSIPTYQQASAPALGMSNPSAIAAMAHPQTSQTIGKVNVQQNATQMVNSQLFNQQMIYRQLLQNQMNQTAAMYAVNQPPPIVRNTANTNAVNIAGLDNLGFNLAAQNFDLVSPVNRPASTQMPIGHAINNSTIDMPFNNSQFVTAHQLFTSLGLNFNVNQVASMLLNGRTNPIIHDVINQAVVATDSHQIPISSLNWQAMTSSQFNVILQFLRFPTTGTYNQMQQLIQQQQNQPQQQPSNYVFPINDPNNNLIYMNTNQMVPSYITLQPNAPQPQGNYIMGYTANGMPAAIPVPANHNNLNLYQPNTLNTANFTRNPITDMPRHSRMQRPM